MHATTYAPHALQPAAPGWQVHIFHRLDDGTTSCESVALVGWLTTIADDHSIPFENREREIVPAWWSSVDDELVSIYDVDDDTRTVALITGPGEEPDVELADNRLDTKIIADGEYKRRLATAGREVQR